MEKNKTVIQKDQNLKYQLQQGTITFTYLTDRVMYQIFKIILSTSLKSMRKRSE